MSEATSKTFCLKCESAVAKANRPPARSSPNRTRRTQLCQADHPIPQRANPPTEVPRFIPAIDVGPLVLMDADLGQSIISRSIQPLLETILSKQRELKNDPSPIRKKKPSSS